MILYTFLTLFHSYSLRFCRTSSAGSQVSNRDHCRSLGLASLKSPNHIFSRSAPIAHSTGTIKVSPLMKMNRIAIPAPTTNRKVMNADHFEGTGRRRSPVPVAYILKTPQSTTSWRSSPGEKQAKAEQVRHRRSWYDGGQKKENSVSLFAEEDRTVPVVGGCVDVKVDIIHRETGIVEFTKFFNGCVINNDGKFCCFSILDGVTTMVHSFALRPTAASTTNDLQKVVQWRWAAADVVMKKLLPRRKQVQPKCNLRRSHAHKILNCDKETTRVAVNTKQYPSGTVWETLSKLPEVAAAMKSQPLINRASHRRSGFRARKISPDVETSPCKTRHKSQSLCRTSRMKSAKVDVLLPATGGFSDEEYDATSRTSSMEESWNLETPKLFLEASDESKSVAADSITSTTAVAWSVPSLPADLLLSVCCCGWKSVITQQARQIHAPASCSWQAVPFSLHTCAECPTWCLLQYATSHVPACGGATSIFLYLGVL